MFYKFLRKLINLYYIQDGKFKKRQVVFDISSRLYPESKVVNMQDRAKLCVGKGTHVRGELFVYPYGDGISIGDNCYVGEYSVIRSVHRISIGDNVLIAHGVTIIDSDSHEIDALKRATSYCKLISEVHSKQSGDVYTAPIIIDDYAWISYGVSILKGVTIGRGAIVGAGSVVTHDVPPFCVVAGNTATVVRHLSDLQTPLALRGVIYLYSVA